MGGVVEKKKKCRSHSQDAPLVVISSSSCVCVWSTEGRVHLLCLRICVRVCVEVMCFGCVCVVGGGAAAAPHRRADTQTGK